MMLMQKQRFSAAALTPASTSKARPGLGSTASSRVVSVRAQKKTELVQDIPGASAFLLPLVLGSSLLLSGADTTKAEEYLKMNSSAGLLQHYEMLRTEGSCPSRIAPVHSLKQKILLQRGKVEEALALRDGEVNARCMKYQSYLAKTEGILQELNSFDAIMFPENSEVSRAKKLLNPADTGASTSSEASVDSSQASVGPSQVTAPEGSQPPMEFDEASAAGMAAPSTEVFSSSESMATPPAVVFNSSKVMTAPPAAIFSSSEAMTVSSAAMFNSSEAMAQSPLEMSSEAIGPDSAETSVATAFASANDLAQAPAGATPAPLASKTDPMLSVVRIFSQADSFKITQKLMQVSAGKSSAPADPTNISFLSRAEDDLIERLWAPYDQFITSPPSTPYFSYGPATMETLKAMVPLGVTAVSVASLYMLQGVVPAAKYVDDSINEAVDNVVDTKENAHALLSKLDLAVKNASMLLVQIDQTNGEHVLLSRLDLAVKNASMLLVQIVQTVTEAEALLATIDETIHPNKL
eukprot:gene15588-21686_t